MSTRGLTSYRGGFESPAGYGRKTRRALRARSLRSRDAGQSPRADRHSILSLRPPPRGSVSDRADRRPCRVLSTGLHRARPLCGRTRRNRSRWGWIRTTPRRSGRAASLRSVGPACDSPSSNPGRTPRSRSRRRLAHEALAVTLATEVGGAGIRTQEACATCFQGRRNGPLCHPTPSPSTDGDGKGLTVTAGPGTRGPGRAGATLLRANR